MDRSENVPDNPPEVPDSPTSEFQEEVSDNPPEVSDSSTSEFQEGVSDKPPSGSLEEVPGNPPSELPKGVSDNPPSGSPEGVSDNPPSGSLEEVPGSPTSELPKGVPGSPTSELPKGVSGNPPSGSLEEVPGNPPSQLLEGVSPEDHTKEREKFREANDNNETNDDNYPFYYQNGESEESEGSDEDDYDPDIYFGFGLSPKEKQSIFDALKKSVTEKSSGGEDSYIEKLLLLAEDMERLNEEQLKIVLDFIKSEHFSSKAFSETTEGKSFGNTFFGRAVRKDWWEVVNACIESDKFTKEALEGYIQGGKTVLHLACECGQEAVVKACLKSKRLTKEALTIRDNWSNSTPLHLAANGGHTNIVKAFLDREEVSLDLFFIKDEYSRTPLHLAVTGGHTEIVGIYLGFKEVSLDVFLMRDRNGKTPLHLAAEGWGMDHANIVKAFLNCEKIDRKVLLAPIIKNGKECHVTPLHLAASKLTSCKEAAFSVFWAYINSKKIHIQDFITNESRISNSESSESECEVKGSSVKLDQVPQQTGSFSTIKSSQISLSSGSTVLIKIISSTFLEGIPFSLISQILTKKEGLSDLNELNYKEGNTKESSWLYWIIKNATKDCKSWRRFLNESGMEILEFAKSHCTRGFFGQLFPIAIPNEGTKSLTVKEIIEKMRDRIILESKNERKSNNFIKEVAEGFEEALELLSAAESSRAKSARK